jgi:hypothetical protein
LCSGVDADEANQSVDGHLKPQKSEQPGFAAELAPSAVAVDDPPDRIKK